MPRARRVDLNQSEIVDALRQCGAEVRVTSSVGDGHPDLIVVFYGWPAGTQTRFAEVKGPRGKFTPAQRRWNDQTRITPQILRTCQEAIDWLGLQVQAISMHERRIAQASHHGGK